MVPELSCPTAGRIWTRIPEPGIKQLSLALQGGFLATRPPGKLYFFMNWNWLLQNFEAGKFKISSVVAQHSGN